jgi:hypothetical protein
VQFAIVMSLVLFVSVALLLYQFLAGTLVGAEDDGGVRWPPRTRRAH